MERGIVSGPPSLLICWRRVLWRGFVTGPDRPQAPILSRSFRLRLRQFFLLVKLCVFVLVLWHAIAVVFGVLIDFLCGVSPRPTAKIFLPKQQRGGMQNCTVTCTYKVPKTFKVSSSKLRCLVFEHVFRYQERSRNLVTHKQFDMSRNYTSSNKTIKKLRRSWDLNAFVSGAQWTLWSNRATSIILKSTHDF